MKQIWLKPGLILAGGITLAATALVFHFTAPSETGQAEVASSSVVALPEPPVITESLAIGNGDTLAGLLLRAGLEQTAATGMIAAIEGTFDVRKLRAGSELMLTRSEEGSLESIEYIIDPDRKLTVLQSEEGYEARVEDVPGTIEAVPVCGTMQSSLFESMEKTGERAELAIRMAGIFAWDLDFYTDPKPGDEFCLLVEKKEYENGQDPTYRRILAAKYNNAGKLYDAYLFADDDGAPRYFSRDGRSLQAAFLRSPIKFEARISSRFSHRRFHPVLKIFRPHLGTDYAAPTGTPVQAIASGTVIFSGYSGGAGNLVKIKHSGGYETQYMHLSRRLVRNGQRVQQGQRIGLVGATGLATGPHLDFRMRKNGAFVNFEKLKLPRSTEIEPRQAEAFAIAAQQFSRIMESGTRVNVALLTGASAGD